MIVVQLSDFENHKNIVSYFRIIDFNKMFLLQ